MPYCSISVPFFVHHNFSMLNQRVIFLKTFLPVNLLAYQKNKQKNNNQSSWRAEIVVVSLSLFLSSEETGRFLSNLLFLLDKVDFRTLPPFLLNSKFLVIAWILQCSSRSFLIPLPSSLELCFSLSFEIIISYKHTPRHMSTTYFCMEFLPSES